MGKADGQQGLRYGGSLVCGGPDVRGRDKKHSSLHRPGGGAEGVFSGKVACAWLVYKDHCAGKEKAAGRLPGYPGEHLGWRAVTSPRAPPPTPEHPPLFPQSSLAEQGSQLLPS